MINDPVICILTFKITDKQLCDANFAMELCDTKLYTGTVGRITHIDTGNKEFRVIFDENTPTAFTLKFGQKTPALLHAYCITFHRCQGSEYDNVLILMDGSCFLNKNTLYTVTTRAQKQSILVTHEYALKSALHKTVYRENRLMKRMLCLDDEYNVAECNEEESPLKYQKCALSDV